MSELLSFFLQLTDLLFFICILLVFIFSYGVVAQALRFPQANASWSLLVDVVYMPYWQMYGELFLEDLQGQISAIDALFCFTNLIWSTYFLHSIVHTRVCIVFTRFV